VRPHASIRSGDVRAAGPETVNPVRSGKPNPAAPVPDRDLVTDLIARQQLECPVQRQLFGVMGRCLPPNHDAIAKLVDGQVPDAAVGRLTDPRLDLLGEGLHRCAPLQRRPDDPGVLRPGRYVNPFDNRMPFLSCKDRHVKQSPSAHRLFWAAGMQRGRRDALAGGGDGLVAVGLPADPDLTAVIDAWDRLPEVVRAGIVARDKRPPSECVHSQQCLGIRTTGQNPIG
jgi:hypothetical protein